MSILPKCSSLFLKTLTILSDQKNRQALRVAGQFFSSIISVQTRGSSKDVRGGVYLVQPNVGSGEMQVVTELRCSPACVMIRKDRRLEWASRCVKLSLGLQSCQWRSFLLSLSFVLSQVCALSCFPFHFLPLLPHAWN